MRGNSRGPGMTVRPNCSNSFPWSNSNQCSLLNLAVHHAIDLDRCEGHLPVRRWETLELTMVGASEGDPGRDGVVTAPDLLDREPKIGKAPGKTLEDELLPGI